MIDATLQKSVKRFERSNGLDTALYKNYLYLLHLIVFISIVVIKYFVYIIT